MHTTWSTPLLTKSWYFSWYLITTWQHKGRKSVLVGSVHDTKVVRTFLVASSAGCLLGQVVVVAGRGKGSWNSKDNDLLSLERVRVEGLWDPAGVLQFRIIRATDVMPCVRQDR